MTSEILNVVCDLRWPNLVDEVINPKLSAKVFDGFLKMFVAGYYHDEIQHF